MHTMNEDCNILVLAGRIHSMVVDNVVQLGTVPENMERMAKTWDG